MPIGNCTRRCTRFSVVAAAGLVAALTIIAFAGTDDPNPFIDWVRSRLWRLVHKLLNSRRADDPRE